MQITNNTRQNFEGAFRIKPNEIKAKTEIPNLFTQGRQIFDNILEAGDRVFVVRDNYDKRIAKYIQENNIRGVEYYPAISTKSGLDSQEPEGLLKLINDKTNKIITDVQEILTISMGKKRPSKKPKVQKEIEKISHALKINIENPKISSTPAFTKIRDEEKKRTINIIMQEKEHTLVYVKPDSFCENSIACIIDGQGNIDKTFNTLEETLKFIKKFKKLATKNVNILTV